MLLESVAAVGSKADAELRLRLGGHAALEQITAGTRAYIVNEGRLEILRRHLHDVEQRLAGFLPRFLALYPVYFAFFYVVMVDDWLLGARGRFGTKLASFAPFALLLPATWIAWLGRLAFDRVVHGPTKRETEFVPYLDPADPAVGVRDLRVVA